MARVQHFQAYPSERAPAHLAAFRAQEMPRAKPRTPSSPYTWSRPRHRWTTVLTPIPPMPLEPIDASPVSAISSSPSVIAPPSRPSDHPVAVGLALTLCPPLGIAMLWASPRFTDEARRFVTGFVVICLCLAALFYAAR